MDSREEYVMQTSLAQCSTKPQPVVGSPNASANVLFTFELGEKSVSDEILLRLLQAAMDPFATIERAGKICVMGISSQPVGKNTEDRRVFKSLMVEATLPDSGEVEWLDLETWRWVVVRKLASKPELHDLGVVAVNAKLLHATDEWLSIEDPAGVGTT